MKSKKYLESLNDKSIEELRAELVNTKKELFNLRFLNATNQLDNTASIREARRNIARIQTIVTKRTK
jgi:large subunit ribosomal protein L29